MKFNIGPVVWRVELVPKTIELDGRRCWGTCDCLDRTIRIWGGASPRMRLYTLMHELTHAWVYSVGPPAIGEEGLCNFISTVMTQFVLDVYRQKVLFWHFLSDPVQTLTRSTRRGYLWRGNGTAHHRKTYRAEHLTTDRG